MSFLPLRWAGTIGKYDQQAKLLVSGSYPTLTSIMELDGVGKPGFDSTSVGIGDGDMTIRCPIANAIDTHNRLLNNVNRFSHNIQMIGAPLPGTVFNAASFPNLKSLPFHYEKGYAKINLRNAAPTMVCSEVHAVSFSRKFCDTWSQSQDTSTHRLEPMEMFQDALVRCTNKYYTDPTNLRDDEIFAHENATWPTSSAHSDWFACKKLSEKLKKRLASMGVIFRKSYHITLVGGQTNSCSFNLGGSHVEPPTYSYAKTVDGPYITNRVMYEGCYPGCMVILLRNYSPEILCSAAGQASEKAKDATLTGAPSTHVIADCIHTETISAVPSLYKTSPSTLNAYDDFSPNAAHHFHQMPIQKNAKID